MGSVLRLRKGIDGLRVSVISFLTLQSANISLGEYTMIITSRKEMARTFNQPVPNVGSRVTVDVSYLVEGRVPEEHKRVVGFNGQMGVVIETDDMTACIRLDDGQEVWLWKHEIREDENN